MSFHRDAFALFRAFAAVVPVYQLKIADELITEHTHDLFVRLVLDNPHFSEYSPTLLYRVQFWKWFISKLELNPEIEIDSRAFSVLYEQTDSPVPPRGIGLAAPQPPAPSYATYYWRLNPTRNGDAILVDPSDYMTATLLESRTLIESGTTGLRTWLAAFHLAHYVIMHPEYVTNKRVLELGAGIGFLGIIVGSLQMLHSEDRESMLFLTDVNTEVLMKCMSNVRLPCNMTSQNERIESGTLDWSDALLPDVSSLRHRLQETIDADIILGADIVFDPSLVPALVSTLVLALAPGPRNRNHDKLALVALNVRNEVTHNLFTSSAYDSGLVIEDLNNYRDTNLFLNTVNWRVDHVDNVRLMKITLKSAAQVVTGTSPVQASAQRSTCDM